MPSSNGSAEPEKIEGFGVLENAMQATDKRRSRKSKKERTGAEELQDFDMNAAKEMVKAANITRDGRRCKLCKASDTDIDDVEPEEFIAWGYPPRNGAVQGTVCYYCRKVFANIYVTRYKSVEDCAKDLTSEEQHKNEFMEWRTFVIAKYCEAGSRFIKIKYGHDAKDERFKKHKIEQVDLEEPEDLIATESAEEAEERW